MTNTTNSHLPEGDRWSAFDALSWITFGAVRAAADDFEFPRREWSRDWKCWPPDRLGHALAEIETGIPWQPGPDNAGLLDFEELRKRARRIVADTGESAGHLLQALNADVERYHANQDRWAKAKVSVNEAMRRGTIRVWGVKALASSRPDPKGVHTLIDPLVLTETRGVDEGGCIDWNPGDLGFVDYRGPAYDSVFFDSVEVQEMWPAPAEVRPGILEWLTNAAEVFLAANGAKAKRPDLIRDCTTALGCTTREAVAGYKQLPGRLRRTRGNHG